MIHDSSLVSLRIYACIVMKFYNQFIVPLAGRTQSTNSTQGYLHQPREYLQRMLSIANKDAARAIVARGPIFPPK